MRKIVLCLMFFAISSAAFAYRPLMTEDAGVAGKAVFQSEFNFDYLKWGDGKLENNLLLVLIYGLSDNIEFSAEFPYLYHNNIDNTTQNGLGDISLVLKDLILPEGEKNPAFVLKGVVKLDNGDFSKGLGSGDKDFSLFAVATKGLGRVILHAQIGYAWIGKKGSSSLRDISLFGIAVDYIMTDAFHLVAEIDGNRHPDSTIAEDPRSWLVGFTNKLSEKMIFDLAFRGGLSAASPDSNITSGLSVTW